MTSNRKTAPDESLTAPQDNSAKLLRFIRDDAPDTGAVSEIADGVFWLRFSLPMTGLDHINLYVLKDGDGWVVVDTGIASRTTRELWETHFKDLMKNRPVNRIIVTHLHPDHAGLAGWMKRRFDAPLLMTRGEYFLCRLMAADTGHEAPPDGLTFYRKAGLNPEQIEIYKARFGGFGKAISPMPQSYDRLQDGDKLTINGRIWHIITGAGHSPEHACLYCPELKVFLSGDQLLPNISSNVSVWPTEPEANPLEDWISSCHKLKAALPEDSLIAPAHGIPFYGAHKRLDKLISHHEKALERLAEYCQTPQRATQVYSVLFRRPIDDGNRIMAVGESIAHLNCLKARGIVRRTLNDSGQFSYQTK